MMRSETSKKRSVAMDGVLALGEDERWHWTCPDDACGHDNSHPGWVGKAACARPGCNVVASFGVPQR